MLLKISKINNKLLYIEIELLFSLKDDNSHDNKDKEKLEVNESSVQIIDQKESPLKLKRFQNL